MMIVRKETVNFQIPEYKFCSGSNGLSPFDIYIYFPSKFNNDSIGIILLLKHNITIETLSVIEKGEI